MRVLKLKTKSLFKRFTFMIALGGVMMGCTHSIHNYHVSDYEGLGTQAGEGRKIEVIEEQFVILGFAFDNDYPKVARQKMLDQCPKGSIKGIHTRYSTSHSFMSYTNKIYIQAICVD